jgi:hypothetical protein
MNNIIEWLLEGPSWVQYHTLVDLLDQPGDSPDAIEARQQMILAPQIEGVIADLADYPSPALKSHKSAGHPLHKLTFLVDIGLNANDPGMAAIIDRIFAHSSPEGPFNILVNIPRHFGGSGEDEFSWMLCDAPLPVYALIQLGLENDKRVQRALTYLTGLVRSNGWPCAAAPSFGKFRGPGRASDPCPYANLVMLKALAASPSDSSLDACRTGAETLLSLWTNSRDLHPYLFHMGNNFRKLKAPMIWYDILHVFDVLTRFSWLQEDPRLIEMADVITTKADLNARFTPESIWMAWKGWDFGQKREPSRWMTLLVHRALKRMNLSIKSPN